MRGMPRKRCYDTVLLWTVPLEQIDHSSLRGCYFILVRTIGLMDGNSTRIRRYHFPMSQTGAWEIEGDRYTYTGPCGLELDLVCRGTSMWLPQHHAYLEASFTLPPREPPVAPEAHDTTFRRTAEAGPSTRKMTWQDCLDAPAYRRAVRRSMPPGTTGRRTLPDPPSSSSEPMEDESTEIEAEADADEDGVIELVNIESSLEVIELSSDSGTEEDPSECSSTPSSALLLFWGLKDPKVGGDGEERNKTT
ncbi:hypothetical protein Lal_00011288 [Lupinus albus]|nr:hypothetical protein Lal_00011288 [Lupinus albus]